MVTDSGSADRYAPRPPLPLSHPSWTREATIYQINTRQFTAEGTLAAARGQLPRLADLGVSILWLMPVHEIGKVGRKGRLGSPYAVRDHYSVSSELGTEDDLAAFIAAAHALGMRVILDWVPNHTAWDHVLVEEHPEWYHRSETGALRPAPWWDWDDIVELDYDIPEMRAWMTAAMRYWVQEFDIDGYRVDVAGFVPLDFFAQVRAELEEIKPVFLLAEWESRDLHTVFDATYGISWHDAGRRIYAGELDAVALRVHYSWDQRFWPSDAQRMNYLTNHDINAWDGTDAERFGESWEAFTVLSFVGEGMPLIYNGQEAGLDVRLDFFDRDPIRWADHPRADVYRRLVDLKKRMPCLHNAPWGASMRPLDAGDPTKVLAFERESDGGRVLAAFNLSAAPVDLDLRGTSFPGSWQDWRTGEHREIGSQTTIRLDAWDYLLLT